MTDTLKNDMFDLETLDTAAGSDAGYELELLNPATKAKTGIFIKVLGKHSEVFRDIVRERTNTRLAAQAAAKRQGEDYEENMTAETVEANAVELLTACTLGWRSETPAVTKSGKPTSKEVIKLGGKELTFTVANCKDLYTRFIWLREQVDNAVGSLENFIKA